MTHVFLNLEVFGNSFVCPASAMSSVKSGSLRRRTFPEASTAMLAGESKRASVSPSGSAGAFRRTTRRREDHSGMKGSVEGVERAGPLMDEVGMLD